jgi:hypothetical protein
MKILKTAVLFLLFASLGQLVYAKNYYFSSTTGNDSYTIIQAQNSTTPWKSLSKLNSFFSSFLPGDSILFKRGDTFNGRIIVSKPGSASLPIIFGAYGGGTNPIISGLVTLSLWSVVTAGIYQSSCPSCSVNVNMVTLNGDQQAMGRYPNSGYLAFQSHSGNTSITDSQLPSTNWTGGEVVIRKNHWIIDRNKITSQSGGTIFYTAASTYGNIDGNGFFIQNNANTLDQLGEWYFKSPNKTMQMYFGTANPASYAVKVSVVDTLVTILNRGYITFTGLTFQGANMYTFCIGGAPHISILNCIIDLSGMNAVFGQNEGTSSANMIIQNSTINHTNNNALYLPSEFTSASILNNKIKNAGMIPGMGNSGDGTYQGTSVNGNNSIIQFNELDTMGYLGIGFSGMNMLIKNNLVNGYCLVKDDGGGIYTYRNSPTDPTQAGTQINGNIVLNGIGNIDGLSNTILEAEGIYTDGYSSGISISNNTVANCANAGLFMNSNTAGTITNNLFYNNNVQIYMNQYNSTGFQNLTLSQNIFFCKQIFQSALGYNGIYGNTDPTLASDNNYFVRPLDDNIVFATNYASGGNTLWNAYNLGGWQAAYSKDKNSKKSPIDITPYILNSLVGSNKYAYGTFEGRTDLPYISTFAPGSSMQASYDNTSKIDGVGSLKVSYTGASTNNMVTLEVEGIGAVSSAKNYIFKFSSLGTTQSRVIGVYLQQVGAPYARLTPIQYLTIPAARSDNQVMLSLPISASSAGVVLQLNSQDGTLWTDNIQFYEANVSITNPDNYILFAYNATNSAKTVPLGNTYVDVSNKAYSGSVTLKPYSSIVLMLPGPGQRKVQQNPAKQTGGKPVVY